MKKAPDLGQISNSDVSALLAALQIIPFIDECESESQMAINCFQAEQATAKLIDRHTVFASNEIRIMYCAIAYALEILSSKYAHAVPGDIVSSLRPYYFNYNRLLPRFEEACDRYSQMK